MSRLCVKLTLAIGVSLLAGLLAVPAIGQTPAPGIRIAVVNVKRINDDFVRIEAEKDNTQDWARQQQEYLDELRTKYMFLSQEAFDEAVEILRQPRPLTAKSLKRQKELRDVNDQNEDRYLELQAKLDRTAQEQDEFNRLQAGVDAREEQIKTIMTDLQRQLDGRQQQSYERIMETVQQTIDQVAAAAKYDLVLNKLIVVYGGDDITDIVLERLTGKPVAAPASPVSPTVAPTPAPAPAPTPAPAPAPTPAPAPAPGAGG